MSAFAPDFILRKDADGETSGSFSGAALFIDIPGFTQLTETLVAHGRAGAEALARTLRFYFDPLIAAVHGAGGFVASFAGDAFTALFPADPGAPEAAAAHVLGAAVAMRRFFEAHPEHATPFGTFPFSFKIGVSWGEVAWGIVEVSPARRYFYFQGPAIEACTSIEQQAQPGDILLDASFREHLGLPGLHAPPLEGRLGPEPSAGPARRRSTSSALPARPAFRLAAFEPGPLPEVRRDAPEPEDGWRRFVDPAVAGAPPLGEFRNVASVFLSFHGISGFPELIRLIHELSALYGGSFGGVDAGDKGITALVHFGAPITHENDVERALGFALDVRARAPEGVDVRAGVTCDIRYAGFNGGTERWEFACLGRATNLAARLVMAAPWGEIWCDEQLVHSVGDGYVWHSQRPRRFRGFEHSILVYALEGRKIAVQRQISELGLLGRDAELARLTQLVEPIFQGSNARVVHIEGEAGVGKSYFVERFRRKLLDIAPPRPLLWLDARCEQTIRSSLNAYEYAMREYFLPDSPPDREGRHVRFEEVFDALLRRLPPAQDELARELVRARAALAALVGIRWRGSSYEQLPPLLRFNQSLSAIGLLVRAECCVRPVVLHVEDAHWADDDTLAATALVARACKDLPLAILSTSRRRDDGTPVRFPLEPEVPEEAITLGPLGDQDLVELAKPVFGPVVPKMILDILRDNAGGNPLYAQEILAYWHAGKGQTMTSITNTFSPPQSITSLLIARLDRLEPAVRSTVLAASVLGREFDVRVLAKMLPDAAVMDRHVHSGEEQCVWSPVKGAATTDARYRFTNVLLCNAAYEMQSRARLRELHRRAADAIQSVHGKDLDNHLTALARHLYRAGAFEEAKPYVLAAARKAEERYAHDEARRLHRALAKITAVIERNASPDADEAPPSTFGPQSGLRYID